MGGRGDGIAKWRDGACYELASVTEHETNVMKSLTTCTSSSNEQSSPSSAAATAAAAGSREHHMYLSTTHSIELHLSAGSTAHRRLGRFLIKYEGKQGFIVRDGPER